PSVTAMDAEKFREYLISEKGKEESAKVFAKPAMQTALNKIEVEGYKEVHNKFQENFQNVAWAAEASSPDQPKTKSCEIKNEAGQVVANIKETTHDKAPIAVTLENGEKVTVKSFRTIEFPLDNKGKGPLHLSMAVKDENGKNIAEKDAVYFTAHYDEKGKLTEVSSPVPVKFMGKGDDAVGYIERNGKVYTLPVTQGKYKEMMKEVAKNKGMGVNLSQEVEKPAEDLAVTKSKTVEPVLEKEEVVKKPAVKEQSIDSIEVVEQEPVPLKIVLPSGLTGGEKTQAVDTALKDATPEQIVATLKNEVSKGGSEIVGLIVESTKPDRTGDHPNVPKLTAEQFKEVYDVGMKSAKAKVDAPANQKTKFMQGLKLNGIHAACAKLAPSAKVDAQSHKQASSTNLSKFNGKHAQISR
ncbi:MAG: Sca4 family protein, partial [Rickettsiaceae bacterium]